ncbi:hypothetical protein [Algibacter sp. 2305UL17-15]|uniref:hypothetical protein n=1 Tax=Algibacter sp. 2305UL17-15 TaxID=3231268 RepID=UPI00345AA6C6
MRVLLLIFLFIGCQSENKTEITTLKFNISETLKTWHLKADVSVEIKEKDTLRVHVYYKKKPESNADKAPYYYDVYSNELIVKTLVYKYRKELDKYQQVNIHLEFEGAPDIADFYLNKTKIKQIHQFFKNSLFYKMVLYSLETFNYNDITLLNSTLKNLLGDIQSTSVASKFNFPVLKYWDILNVYSDLCSKITLNNDSNDLSKVELLFITIGGFNKNFKEYENSPNTDKKLTKLLGFCDIDRKILDMSYQDMDAYLREKFGNGIN